MTHIKRHFSLKIWVPSPRMDLVGRTGGRAEAKI